MKGKILTQEKAIVVGEFDKLWSDANQVAMDLPSKIDWILMK